MKTATDDRRIWVECAILASLPALLAVVMNKRFTRYKPFINIIQAVVIGKKPGSWPFPSGHSATAFAGAWLLSRDFPSHRSFIFLIASLVAFSRIYLGDHYPGDVFSGTFSGMVIAEIARQVQRMVVRMGERILAS